MAMSKHQLAGSLTKKTLTLEGKIKLLDANKERKQSCRQLAEMFNIGKTAAANIIKNEASIRKEYEKFKDNFKRKTRAGWLEKWEISYGVRERKVNGEAGEMAEYTVNAWMERLMELTRGYELTDIWNMDETGCFFKALPEKGLAEKKSQARGGKKLKTMLNIAFFMNAAGEKAIKPLVVWRSKKPRCFKNIKSLSRPHGIYYYPSPKAWMTAEITTSILGKINQQMEVAKRKIIIFMDNAPCHPESLSE